MSRYLVAEKIKIHPGLAAPAFVAVEDSGVEIASGLKIAYEKREMNGDWLIDWVGCVSFQFTHRRIRATAGSMTGHRFVSVQPRVPSF